MTTEQKTWIDNMDYAALLRYWRRAPIGDPIFTGDTGDYYAKVMEQKGFELSHDERVEISKRIGW